MRVAHPARLTLTFCRLLAWLDYLPLAPLALAAVLLAFMPLDEPHLWQKLNMLFHGGTLRALDVADLALHLGLPLLVGIKWLRDRHCLDVYKTESFGDG